MKSSLRRGVVPLFILVVVLSSTLVAQRVSPDVAEARARKILAQMTLEEKVAYIGGVNDFYVRAIPRLNVPELKMADGPAGVRNYGHAAAFPTGIAMAASWDPAIIQKVGAMMGKDSRARGVHFLLAPGMNIYRAPMCGRNFEYFGEDPYLAAQIAVADIKGIQSQDVIATAKHYAANNQEWDRHNVSSDVDERTLREIYLRAFEAAVRDAKVGAIMDSYNLINGVHATQNGHLNDEVAKGDWGFRGVMMSDWDATYDGVAAANHGLDLEMPSGKFMNAATLIPAVKSGQVSEAKIDEKVLRILRTAIEFGFFDRPQQLSSIPLDNPEAHTVALDAARGSIVLLKNDGVLPLATAKVKKIALIGPNAATAAYGGGGSGLVSPFHAVSPLEGLQKFLGSSAQVEYAPGVVTTTEEFKKTTFTQTPGGAPGLKAEYWNNKNLEGAPAVTRVDPNVAFDWGQGSYAQGQPEDHFSARWTGYYTPAESGSFNVVVAGDDGYRLYLDDKLIVEDWTQHSETTKEKKIDLQAGHAYKVRLEFFEEIGDAKVGMGIFAGRNNAVDQAAALAAKSDAAVLCVGFNARMEGEGFDRPFELPQDQQDLIRAVLAANLNTVVVINAGGNVEMASWIDHAKAVIHAWYPGQEGGTALAEILFGAVNPSGKLPISLERRWEDNATFNSYYDKDKSKHVAYSEGVFLGYRHFDRASVKPLYPFGYGLSYTTFEYSGEQAPMKAATNAPVQVHFTVKNTGKVAGREIAEVYVAPKNPKIERPVKELKGFAKVDLKPGESRQVTVALDPRSFAYYDVNKKDWAVDEGDYDILVGASSADIKLKSTVHLAGK